MFDQIRFPNGVTFNLGQGYDNFKSSLLEVFPEEEDTIDNFCATIKEICKFFPLFNLKSSPKQSIGEWPDILNVGAYEYLSSITSNENLIAAILGNGPLYAGEKGVTPLYVTALIVDSFINGSYRIKGGGSQLTKILCRNIRSLGGELIKRANVINIEVEGKEVKYFEIDDGRKIYAKNYISNIHPHQTNKMIGQENIRPAYKKRIEKLENTVSSFTLYLSFKENSFPYLNYNIYDYFVEPKNVWDIISYERDTWPKAIFSCTASNLNQGEFADSLTVLTYMDFEEAKSWSDSFNTAAYPGERHDDYHEFKKKKEEQVISRLEERFPGIRDCILHQYSSTPLTYKDYIGTDDGSLYGIKKNINKQTATSINSKMKITNMYLTGQNIVFHGILGATISALVTCMNFIDGDQLIKKIADE
jgi:all-trans-retinol 13,14-reductase